MVKFNDKCFNKGGWLSNLFANVFKILVVVLILGLLVIIVRELYHLFFNIMGSEISYLVTDMLFILILVNFIF